MEYSRLTGEGLRQVEPITPEEMDRRLAGYAGPHGLDTVPLLGVLRTPTLWLLGDDDESIPIRQTKAHLQRAIALGAPITVTAYPGVNHGLQRRDGSMPPFWADTLAWLRERGILQ